MTLKETVAPESQLFHPDNKNYFNIGRLERLADREIDTSSLIMRSASGDRSAACALSRGFWPFVSEFEKAIDRRLIRLPRQPLYDKFGHPATRDQLRRTPVALKALEKSEIEGVFPGESALREMQQDERRHSFHWAKDAENLGVSRIELESAPVLPAVQRLIDGANNPDIVMFFAGSLAATEFIAESLGKYLAHTAPYTSMFNRRRAIWMEVHTVPHDDGPSHEEIVMDFARAFSSETTPALIESYVAFGINAFGEAAREVERYYCPKSALLAAE